MTIGDLFGEVQIENCVFGFRKDEVDIVARQFGVTLPEEIVEYLEVFGCGEWSFGLIVAYPFAPKPRPGLLANAIRRGVDNEEIGRGGDYICFGYSTLNGANYGVKANAGSEVYVLNHSPDPVTLVAPSLSEYIVSQATTYLASTRKTARFHSPVTPEALPAWEAARSDFRVKHKLGAKPS